MKNYLMLGVVSVVTLLLNACQTIDNMFYHQPAPSVSTSTPRVTVDAGQKSNDNVSVNKTLVKAKKGINAPPSGSVNNTETPVTVPVNNTSTSTQVPLAPPTVGQ